MVYIETSAKTRVGIQQTFEELVQKILDQGVTVEEQHGGTNLGANNAQQQQDSYGCC